MTTNQKFPNTAKVDHVLVFYDGPQLLTLLSDRGTTLIAHAIERDGFNYPLFCCEPNDRLMNLYLLGKADLRFVFQSAAKSRLYFTDLGGTGDELKLVKAKAAQVNDDVLPEPGIFSTVHTHPLHQISPDHKQRQRFLIDGLWEARDFSQFHGKMADTYSLLAIAKRLDENVLSATDAAFLKDSIAERPWQGGGSYLSFYGAVKQKAVSVHPLRVAGIEYHSPGYVEVEGRGELLDDIVQSIDIVITQGADIVKKYKAIRKSLKAEGLLTSDREATFSTDAVQSYVERQTLLLAQQLGLPNGPGLLRACDSNVAVFAKLVLSYFRRVRGLALFYVEGRVRNG